MYSEEHQIVLDKNNLASGRRVYNFMSDRFLLKACCSVCGTNLNEPDEQTGQELCMAIGDNIVLKCPNPKCHTRWQVWQTIQTQQKKIKEALDMDSG